jgi:hypothetical protein
MAMHKVSIWDRNKLFVDAEIKENGDLLISGQDLNGEEYEYFLTVERSAVPQVLSALGATATDDVLEELRIHAEELVHVGEHSWLKANDIPVEIFVC